MGEREDRDQPRAKVEDVLAEFEEKNGLLSSCCEKTYVLLIDILRDADIRYQSIQARVKSRDKIRQKYLDDTKTYKQLDDITDQVAFRIITYYEDEVNRVAEIIKHEFHVDNERSVDKRETEPNKFGYYALNFVCKYSLARTSQVEYKKFSGVWCEIQIVSILRHAWSEIEHPWYDLKDAYPDEIKRRFARMAALLEIAESEFLSLRKIQSDYGRALAVQVEAQVPEVPLDGVSLRAFIAQEPLVRKLDRAVASALECNYSEVLSDKLLEKRASCASLAGITKVQELRQSLTKYAAAIPEYARRCRNELWKDLSVGRQAEGGISIYWLSLIVVSLRGEEAALDFFRSLKINPLAYLERQVAISREVVAKFAN